MSYETMVGVIFATAVGLCIYIATSLKTIKEPFKTPLQGMFFLFALVFLVCAFGSGIQATKFAINDINSTYVNAAGDTMTGNLSMGNNTVKSFYGFQLPNYDSGWVAFAQGEFKTLTHNLSGDVNNYFVDIMANDSSDGGTGLNNVYHGLNKEGVTGIRRGFYWFNLNTTSITVYRGAQDARAPHIKVRIWKIYNDDDDARVALGAGNSSDPLDYSVQNVSTQGNITGNFIYGKMWNYSSNATAWNFDLDVKDVYYNLTGLQVGELNGFSFTDESQANGGSYMTLHEAGLYELSASFSFSATQGDALYGVGIAKNHNITSSRDCYSREWARKNEVDSTTVSCFLDLEVDDRIVLQVENEDNNRDIEVHTVSIQAVRVGN